MENFYFRLRPSWMKLGNWTTKAKALGFTIPDLSLILFFLEESCITRRNQHRIRHFWPAKFMSDWEGSRKWYKNWIGSIFQLLNCRKDLIWTSADPKIRYHRSPHRHDPLGMKDDNSACSHSIHLNGHHLDNKNAGEVHSIVYVLLRVRRRVLHNFLIAIFSALATVSILLCSDTFLGTPTPITASGLFKPTSYEVIHGFFAQSLNSTNDTTFDFVWTPIFSR